MGSAPKVIGGNKKVNMVPFGGSIQSLTGQRQKGVGWDAESCDWSGKLHGAGTGNKTKFGHSGRGL